MTSTLNSDATPDGATDAQKPRPRRRRSPRAHDAATTPATSAVEQASAPAPAIPEAPAAEVTPAEGSTDETQHGRGASGRSRRGRGRGEGRKGAVQLIVPPTHTAEGAATSDEGGAPAAASSEPSNAGSDMRGAPSAEAATPEARVVPVTTDGAPAATVESAPDEAATPRSRYRFAPRTPTVTAPPLVRPERLSSTLVASAPERTETPTAEPAITPSGASEDEADDWHAMVAEVAPADVARLAAEAQSQATAAAQAIPASDEHAVDDLMSALGLHDRPRAALSEAIPEARSDEAAEAMAEAENGAAEESSEAEGQNGTRRRRRRRRGSSHPSIADELEEDRALADALAETPALPDEESEPGRNGRNGYEPYTPYGALDQPYSPYTRAPRERAPQPSAWEVSASQQSSGQYGQYGSSQSAYGSPEPSFARGFGPQPRGVAGPPREPLVRSSRAERGVESPASSSQLVQAVSSAIQQQTDRLLTELRRQQQPPAMMLQLPATPSVERVGVFVDVANLIYSARSMRMPLDFGRMLDFLRSNRRLVRAHAYAPTDPAANADQSFLNAVKGMGYRITTKNYKTFSSGAKKADMDLDLCMDIVRIVDAGAVDTIVLVSGDSDFLPLLEYCSDHGVRVEVAAFDDAAAMILRQSCDLFINLSLVDEIRA